MGASAFVAGIVGGALAASGAVWLVEPMASRVPAARHVAFLAVAWAHAASYAVGALGGVALCVWVWRRRGVTSGAST